MEQKKLKFNIVDLIAVVLILAVIIFVGYKRMNRGGEAEEVKTITMNYTVKCEGVDQALYETCQKYLPSQLMASGTLYNGYINSVRQEPYYVMAPDGSWVESPDRVTLYFEVEATIPKTSVITSEIAKQEVRIGKADYILKSEYIEFKEAQIVDATWTED